MFLCKREYFLENYQHHIWPTAGGNQTLKGDPNSATQRHIDYRLYFQKFCFVFHGFFTGKIENKKGYGPPKLLNIFKKEVLEFYKKCATRQVGCRTSSLVFLFQVNNKLHGKNKNSNMHHTTNFLHSFSMSFEK